MKAHDVYAIANMKIVINSLYPGGILYTI